MKPKQRAHNGKTDWEEIHARLSRASTVTQEALSFSGERGRAVMEERARALARAPASAVDAGEVIEIMTFTLAQEHYAIETRHIREVVGLTAFTPLPGAPAYLVGVINLRGECLAVIDLRKFFGVAGKGASGSAHVVVLGGERPEFGLLADEVHEVTRLPSNELLKPPESIAGIGPHYLRGVTPDALIVLDGTGLLQDNRLFIEQSDDKRYVGEQQ